MKTNLLLLCLIAVITLACGVMTVSQPSDGGKVDASPTQVVIRHSHINIMDGSGVPPSRDGVLPSNGRLKIHLCGGLCEVK